MNWFDTFNSTPGWLSGTEGAMLHALVYAAHAYCPAGAVVELGTGRGRSAIALGSACKAVGVRLWSIDRYEVGYDIAPAQAAIEAAGLADTVMLVEADSVKYGRDWPAATPVSLVFVDAAHDIKGVSDDLDAWWPHIALHGFCAIHDKELPGVYVALQEHYRNRFAEIQEVASVVRSLVVYKRMAVT